VDLEPDVLRGPPSILAAIASELASSRPPSRLRLVFTAGERLEAETREHLEAVLGVPVHDLYGATEAGCIAWRCPACEAYHVNSDTVLVEVLNNGRPAHREETGAVVITNLFARTMPFIRYQLGDLARLGPSCPEAPGAVTLRSLDGRTSAPLIGAHGTRLSPYTFMPDEIEGIAEYRVIQERPDLVRVLVVPGAGFQTDALERARQKYQQRLGTRCRIEFELRESLVPAEHRDGEASPHPPDAIEP
jgi:phenylacetate-CoA ligase